MDKLTQKPTTTEPPLDPPAGQETPNQSEQNVSLTKATLGPDETIEKQKRIILDQKEQITELKERAKKYAFEPHSRKFRLYLALLQGATARGLLDPETLKKSGGTQYAQAICLNFANIAEQAQQISEGKF